jgi:membrane associated rhomboid family serine protease
VIAAATQTFLSPHSVIPMVGASGAISGVLGAYILLYPRVRVHVLILLPFLITRVTWPAYALLGYWIVLQLFGGFTSLSQVEQGGVAFFAHIGGFLAGLILVRVFVSEDVLRRRPTPPASYYRYRTF